MKRGKQWLLIIVRLTLSLALVELLWCHGMYMNIPTDQEKTISNKGKRNQNSYIYGKHCRGNYCWISIVHSVFSRMFTSYPGGWPYSELVPIRTHINMYVCHCEKGQGQPWVILDQPVKSDSFYQVFRLRKLPSKANAFKNISEMKF